MELDWSHLSEPDTTNKFRDILTTKEEMLSSLDSRFDQSYSAFLLPYALNPRFKVNFLTQQQLSLPLID